MVVTTKAIVLSSLKFGDSDLNNKMLSLPLQVLKSYLLTKYIKI